MDQLPHLLGPLKKPLKAFARDLPIIEHGSPEAVHRSRVSSRRLRELLPILPLDQEAVHKFGRELRAFAKRLGRVRELDVIAQLVEDLQQNGRYPAGALRNVGAAVAEARGVERQRLSDRLSTSKLQKFADRLERVAKEPGPQGDEFREHLSTQAWRCAGEARLVQRANRARTAIERAGALYAVEPLHDVRLALKKLRYAAELLDQRRRPRLRSDLSVLKSAQGRLGLLHDLELLISWARDKQDSLPPTDANLRRQFVVLIRAMEYDCRRLHAAYMGDREGLLAIVRRLSATKRARSTASGRMLDRSA